MSIHLLAVGMYEGASTMAAFKQKAVVHPNMVVNTLVVARDITASGAFPNAYGWTFTRRTWMLDRRIPPPYAKWLQPHTASYGVRHLATQKETKHIV